LLFIVPPLKTPDVPPKSNNKRQ